MAEDAGDKTEAPTPRRLEEAREQGNIARSADLTASVLLLGTAILLQMWGGKLFSTLRGLLESGLGTESLSDLSTENLLDLFAGHVIHIGLAMLPLFLGIALIGVVINILQVGFHINTERMIPNFAALNPVKGWSRIFPKGQAFVSTLLSTAKLIVVGSVAWSAVSARMPQVVMAQQLAFGPIVQLLAETMCSMALRIGLILLILGILDFAWQKWRVLRDLRMSKQEIKEEMRRMDGDPHIKQRRRQVAMQMVQQRLKKQVPQADVVVTNPTHFAVALKYDDKAMGAPRVVAKGQDLIAFRIRQIAIENGIPVLERKPLARALYRLCEVGQEIPDEFYSAVAEILAYVYEITGKIKKKQAKTPAEAVASNKR